MSAARDTALSARNDAIESLHAELVQKGEDVLAIELCGASDDERRQDRALVRGALDDGLSASAIGPLFVAVIADLTYDVDWGDHFRFWPLLHEALGSTRLRLADHNEDRRDVAAAFQALASRTGTATPRGGFAEQFSLMSWPLVHAGLPRCAHRPMARLLERAITRGILSSSASEWPTDDVSRLSADIGAPLFLQGLLEHPGVSKRIGSALLKPTDGAAASGWLGRLSEDIHADKVVKDCIDAARERLDRPRAGRRPAEQEHAPRLDVVLERSGDAFQARLEFGPLEDDLSAVQGLGDFVHEGGALRVRCGATWRSGGFLLNALRARLSEPLLWQGGPLIVELDVKSHGGDLSKVRAYLARARLERPLPLLFREEGEGRFLLSSGASRGDLVVVILDARDPHVRALEAKGFVRDKIVSGAPVIVLRGAAVDALNALGFAVSAPRARLRPVIAPPLSRDRSRLVYPEGQDAWLAVEGLPSDAEPRATFSIGSSHVDLELKLGAQGERLVRVPAEHIRATRSQLRIVEAGGEALCAIELATRVGGRPNVEPERWRAILHPASASIEHLLAGVCWLDVSALPGIEIEVQFVTPARGVVAEGAFKPRAPLFETVKRLRGMVDALDDEEKSRLTTDQELIVRARAIDEPGAFREIARLGPARDPLRFEVRDSRLIVVSEEGVASPELWRLVLGSTGAKREPVSAGGPLEPGVYFATCGESWAAACIASGASSMPKAPVLGEIRRGRERCIELLQMLRAADIARLEPRSSLGRALFARRFAGLALEREIVAALCSAAWIGCEDEAAREGLDGEALVRAFAPMLWIDPELLLEELDTVEDPISALYSLLPLIGGDDGDDREFARHLLLTFSQRGMASRQRDRGCVEWAWTSVQRARLVRLCFLASKLDSALDGGSDD